MSTARFKLFACKANPQTQHRIFYRDSQDCGILVDTTTTAPTGWTHPNISAHTRAYLETYCVLLEDIPEKEYGILTHVEDALKESSSSP